MACYVVLVTVRMVLESFPFPFGHGIYGSEGGQCNIICVFHLAHFVTLYILHLSAR